MSYLPRGIGVGVRGEEARAPQVLALLQQQRLMEVEMEVEVEVEVEMVMEMVGTWMVSWIWRVSRRGFWSG